MPTPIKEADVQMQTLRDDQCILLVPTSMLRFQDCTRIRKAAAEGTSEESAGRDQW